MPEHSAVRRLHELGRLFPGIWEGYARMLSALNAEGSAWASWCYCPLAGAHALLSGGREMPPGRAPLTAEVAGLAAWRATQGIYRIHPGLLHELLATPLTDDIPVDVLMRMPEWCVYVEMPPAEFVGFFAFLEEDANDGRAELRFLLDPADSQRRLVPFAMHLNRGSVRAGLESAIELGRENTDRLAKYWNDYWRERNSPTRYSFEAAIEDTRRRAPMIEGLVSTLLYLCADDIDVPPVAPAPPRVVVGKKRSLLPTPKHGARIYDCGTRIGPALEAAQRRAAAPSVDGGHHAVIPHIRRAHWHTYWTGPRDGARIAKLRWLHPIRVNLDANGAPDVAVVRRVSDVGKD